MYYVFSGARGVGGTRVGRDNSWLAPEWRAQLTARTTAVPALLDDFDPPQLDTSASRQALDARCAIHGKSTKLESANAAPPNDMSPPMWCASQPSPPAESGATHQSGYASWKTIVVRESMQ